MSAHPIGQDPAALSGRSFSLKVETFFGLSHTGLQPPERVWCCAHWTSDKH